MGVEADTVGSEGRDREDDLDKAAVEVAVSCRVSGDDRHSRT